MPITLQEIESSLQTKLSLFCKWHSNHPNFQPPCIYHAPPHPKTSKTPAKAKPMVATSQTTAKLSAKTNKQTNCSSVLNAMVLKFGGMGSVSVVTGYQSLLLCTYRCRLLPFTHLGKAQRLSKACGPERCSVRMLITDSHAKN